MPAITKSNISGDGYTVRGHLSFLTETVLMSRAVNMATITYPVTTITFDDAYSGTGSYTDVVEGCEVIVYSGNTTTVKGRLRVAPGGASSTVLQVNEFSQGELDLADNDKFDVVWSFRVRTRLVEASELFRKDSRIDVGTLTTELPPAANGGGPYVNWASRATSVAFNAAYSQWRDATSVATLTYEWTAPSGASPSSSTSTAPTFDLSGCGTGTHYMTLVATDPDNGTTHTKYIPIRLHDDNDPPTELSEARLTGRAEQGWQATFTIPGTVSMDDVPDGSLVMYWEEEYRNGTLSSYGNRHTSRSHIKFVGYLIRDSIRKNAEDETLTFEAQNPMSILGMLTGFSQILTRTTETITTWQYWRELNTQIAIDSLHRYATTFLYQHDAYYGMVTAYAYPEFFIQQQNPLEQMRELARAIDGTHSCDRTGNVWLLRPLSMDTSIYRDVAATVVTLDDDDVLDITVNREHRDQVNMVDGRGFTSAYAAQPVFSKAPGLAPGDAPSRTTHERLLCVSQTDLNQRTGRKYAYLNRLYNGARRPKDIQVRLRGGYDVFDPAYANEWVKLDNITTARGETFDNLRCLVTAVDVTVRGTDSGIEKSVSLTLEPETEGVAGVTYVPPEETTTVIDYPPVEPPGTTPPIVGISYGTGKMALFCVNGLARTTTWNGASPVWDYASWGSLSVGGTFQVWVPDGFVPGSGWVVTTTGVYYGSISDRSFTLKKSFSSAFDAVGADASFGVQNHFVVAGYRETGTTGVSVYYTTDNSTYSSEINVTGFYNNIGYYGVPSVYVSPKTAGLVYVGAFTATGGEDSTAALYRSTNYGATWAASTALTVPSDSVYLYASFKIPFAHSDELTAFYATSQGYASHLLYRSVGTAQTNITPTISGNNYAPLEARRDGLDISVANKNRMVVVGYKTVSGTYAAFLTNDAFSATPTWTTIAGDGTAYRHCALAGDTPNVGWAWGTGNVIDQLSISGSTVTFASKTGDLADYSVGEIIAIAGWT